MSLSLSQPPAQPIPQSELSPEILAIVNNRRITEHSAMIWNIPSTQTIYSVVAAFQEACGEIVGVGAMHDMREDPTLKCIRASFATPYSLQIALNLSGTLWGGSKLLIRKYKGPNHGKTNSNLLLAQNGFNLNGINNLPSNLNNMSIQDIQQHTSANQINHNNNYNNNTPSSSSINTGINTLVNNGAINAGRGSNKTMAQQIFQHLDMQQLAYLMLVQQHITQNNQFKEQEEREKKEKEARRQRRERRDKGLKSDDDDDQNGGNNKKQKKKKKKEKKEKKDKKDDEDDIDIDSDSSSSIHTDDIDTDELTDFEDFIAQNRGYDKGMFMFSLCCNKCKFYVFLCIFDYVTYLFIYNVFFLRICVIMMI